MADNTNNKYIAEKPTEVSLKTPSDFQVTSSKNQQQQESEFGKSSLTECFTNILEKFTTKQANIMGNFAEFLTENQTKNMNKISSEIGKQFNNFNENLTAYKVNRNSGEATISVNPNKSIATGEATISVNPITSRANARIEDGSSTSCDESSQCEKEVKEKRKAKRKRLSSSKSQSKKKHIRDSATSRHQDDEISLYGGSDLDEQIDRLVDKGPNANAKEGSNYDEVSDEDDLIKDIENDFCSVEKTGEPIDNNLAKIINNVVLNPISKDKLLKKLDSHPRPENLNSLRVKKCNREIWSEMVQSKTRSKDLKIQKMQGCILKAVGVISKVTNSLIDLKNNKDVSPNNFRSSLSSIVHECTDSLALLSHVNSTIEQNRRDNIAYCLDSQYRSLRKNVPSESEFLFGDDLPKRIMNLTTNKKLFNTPSNSFNTFKNSKNLYRFPQIPGNRNQNGYQKNFSGQYQKPQNSSQSSYRKHQKQKTN